MLRATPNNDCCHASRMLQELELPRVSLLVLDWPAKSGSLPNAAAICPAVLMQLTASVTTSGVCLLQLADGSDCIVTVRCLGEAEYYSTEDLAHPHA